LLRQREAPSHYLIGQHPRLRFFKDAAAAQSSPIRNSARALQRSGRSRRQTDYDFYPPERAERYRLMTSATERGETRIREETIGQEPNAIVLAPRRCRSKTKVARRDRADPAGFDITDRKRAAQEPPRAIRRRPHAFQIAATWWNVSHDLRTPISAILGFCQMPAGGNLWFAAGATG
jgi:signal transduction histidine kinase